MNGLRSGDVAIVTGAAGGIGLGIVQELVESGVNVACWDREGADLDRALNICKSAHVSATATEVDVRNRDQLVNAAEAALNLGTVEYGVNCAGVDDLQPTATLPTEDWQRVIDINLTGILFSCLAEYEVMKKHGGAIVNIASMSGIIVNRGAKPHVAYSASKAGVIQLTKCLAVEWAPQQIRVNAVSPGYTKTEMTAMNPKDVNDYFCDQTPMGRMAEVSEIASSVAFLLGSGASYINAHNLVVEGALTAW
jgi:NAD(P)-dependent dehydrogenase (short-subunit alcohol dehydrogenase family)